jgi:hypothetical protein
MSYSALRSPNGTFYRTLGGVRLLGNVVSYYPETNYEVTVKLSDFTSWSSPPVTPFYTQFDANGTRKLIVLDCDDGSYLTTLTQKYTMTPSCEVWDYMRLFAPGVTVYSSPPACTDILQDWVLAQEMWQNTMGKYSSPRVRLAFIGGAGGMGGIHSSLGARDEIIYKYGDIYCVVDGSGLYPLLLTLDVDVDVDDWYKNKFPSDLPQWDSYDRKMTECILIDSGVTYTHYGCFKQNETCQLWPVPEIT